MRMAWHMSLLLLMQMLTVWTEIVTAIPTTTASTTTPSTTIPHTPLPHPPVRLVHPTSRCSGRVEIFLNGQWGTVCDDIWELPQAQVVCRQLGCGGALAALPAAYFGEGSGPIWLDNVQCTGNESEITDCAHPAFGSHDCGHREDAGVICEDINSTVSTTTPSTTTPSTTTPSTTTPHTPLPHPPVRLVHPTSRCSGRVEIFLYGQWGTVCDDIWELPQAQVVCRQLGCGGALAALPAAYFGEGSGPIWLDNVQCTGNESEITDCAHPGFGSHDCDHREDAGVICEDINSTVSTTTPFTTTPSTTTPYTTIPHTPLPHLPVRLVHPTSRCSGRVEIFLYRQWGTVCDDFWELPQAQVVCRQLGCGRALAALPAAYFGEGSGPIWLDNVQCTGNESEITDCAHPAFGSHDCDHREDAGVICEDINSAVSTTTPFTTTAYTTTPHTPLPHPPVRLVHPTSRCSGRVEIFLYGQWGTVCDDIWELPQAQVVCRQLGCGGALAALPAAYFGEGSGPIWLDNVQCTGNESEITDCAHPGFGSHNCVHREDAGVICEEPQRLLQLSQVVCSRYQLEVGVHLSSVVFGFNLLSGHLAVPSCSSYRLQDNVVWYQVQRQAGICGTVLMTNSTHAIYSNSLFLYPLSNSSLVVPEVIPFSCAYPLETNTSLNTGIRLQLQEGGLRGSGTKATASMLLFRDSNFINSYALGQITLPVGSALHVGVFVADSDPSFALVLDNCYTTPSSNPDDPIQYFLIHSRCPTNPHVSVVENGLSLRARFSALLFPAQSTNPYIFLHCRLSLCDKRSYSCVPLCSRRTYRSLTSSAQLNPLTIGPITWEN